MKAQLRADLPADPGELILGIRLAGIVQDGRPKKSRRKDGRALQVEDWKRRRVKPGNHGTADVRAAFREGYGVEPVDTGVGGSIPFISDLVRENPGAQILVTGVEDPHSRAHSPNESLHLETFGKALVSEALLLEKLDGRTV